MDLEYFTNRPLAYHQSECDNVNSFARTNTSSPRLLQEAQHNADSDFVLGKDLHHFVMFRSRNVIYCLKHTVERVIVRLGRGGQGNLIRAV